MGPVRHPLRSPLVRKSLIVAGAVCFGFVVNLLAQVVTSRFTDSFAWQMVAGAVAVAGVTPLLLGRSPRLPLRAPRLRSLGRLLLVLVLVWLTAQVVALWLTENTDLPASSTAVEGLSAAAALTGVVLAAPVSEELLMRRVLYAQLRTVLRAPVVVAAFVSAIPFALLHGSVIQASATVFLGLYAALVYERTGTVFAAIAAHMAFNALSVYVPARFVEPLATGPVTLTLVISALVALTFMATFRRR